MEMWSKNQFYIWYFALANDLQKYQNDRFEILPACGLMVCSNISFASLDNKMNFR